MELFLILIAAFIVVVFTILSFFTSLNSGASKFERWFEKKDKNKTN
jgi:hypothetical protein